MRSHAGASDIHFEPYEKFYRIRYRIDGILSEVAQPPLAIKDKVASRIKVISRLDISEKRVPQDGRMKLVLSKSKAIDFRVSTLPTLFGEKIVHADPRLVRREARYRGARLRAGPAGGPAACDRAPVRDDPGHRPDRLRQDGVALHVPQHPEPAGHQHLDRRGPGGNPAAGRQPGERERQGGPHVRERAALVPAPGSGHRDGGRNPRPRDRRHRDQGVADRPPRALHAAHERRADDADPPAEHGRRAVQHRLVGDPDHRAAARPQAVPAMQEARGHPARGAAGRRLQ